MNVSNQRILCVAAALVAATDFLLWPAEWGLSFGLWIVVLITAIACCRTVTAWKGRPFVLGTLLIATAFQSAVEISFSNGLVAVALLIGLIGETAFPMLPRGWARCSEALWALVKAPGRWFWVRQISSKAIAEKGGTTSSIARWLQIVFPALFVCFVFTILFSLGNAIFSNWVGDFFATLLSWFSLFDLSFGHLLFYGLIATLALAALNPALPGNTSRIWTRTLPFLPEGKESISWWRSMVMLAGLNTLFFLVNTIDAFYLWTKGSIPPGISPQKYLHEGVGSLSVAVVLSAILLTLIFQQKRTVSGSRGLKRLGYLWIAQNMILIANVAHRVISYVEVSQLTPRRIYVGFFLLLVLTGFVFLTIHIARGSTLNRLILRNGIATLLLFFLLQFMDVAGWVARFNVARWEDGRGLDLDYLSNLGPSAWPALARVAKSKSPEGITAKSILEGIANTELGKDGDWRSWQARRAMNLGVLRRVQ